jgi:rhamnogalacturonyl hydrolase YesR
MPDATFDKVSSYLNWLLVEKHWRLASGTATWNYVDGVGMPSLHNLYMYTKNPAFFGMEKAFYDHLIKGNLTVSGWKPTEHILDNIEPARQLIYVYEETGNVHYKKVADLFRKNFDDYPRTSEGSFWHQAHPRNQVGLMGCTWLSRFIRCGKLSLGRMRNIQRF